MSAVVVMMPLLRAWGFLVMIIILRSLSDFGLAANSSIVPNGIINAAIGLVVLSFALVPSRSRAPQLLKRLAVAITSILIVATAVGLWKFGFDGGAISEALRLLSVVTIMMVAARQQALSDQTLGSLLAVSILPASAVLIVGNILKMPLMESANGRATGSFSHANSAAAFMSVAILACLGVWLWNRSKAMLATASLALVALFLTESLGALIGLCIGALVIIICSAREIFGRALLAVGVLTIGGYFLLAYTRLTARIAEFTSFNVPTASAGADANSLEWRLLNWHYLYVEWKKSPWLGYGLGSTTTEITPLGAPPHSLPMQLLLETGIIGCLAVFILLVIGVHLLLRRVRHGRREISILLGLLAFAVVNGAESNLLAYTAALYLAALVSGALFGRIGFSSRGTIPVRQHLRRDAAEYSARG
jgi:O-antigen ligase